MARINVFITVDTEHSIGGAFGDGNLKPVGNDKRIWGKFGDKSFGIPLIMDIAKACNIRLTFFVEVMNKYHFGESETKQVCEYIMKRGHDVQLHLHPNYLNFTLNNPQEKAYSDLIGTYSLEKQIDLIKEGIEILIQTGASRPIAFRAGCFGASEETLRALKAVGVLIDSSYNKAYVGDTCLLDNKGINDLTYLNWIWEFPITNFIESTKVRPNRFKPLDINGVSFQEMRSVLNQAKEKGPRNITIIMHSFSFLKPSDVQYSKVRPRGNVIQRFQRLCQFLEENTRFFEVRTFSSLDKEELTKISQQSSHFFPQVPLTLSVMRGFQQLKDALF
jgi:hypothetical protein